MTHKKQAKFFEDRRAFLLAKMADGGKAWTIPSDVLGHPVYAIADTQHQLNVGFAGWLLDGRAVLMSKEDIEGLMCEELAEKPAPTTKGE